LTNAKPEGIDPRELYKGIGHLCRRKGLNPYVPHLHTDPQLHRDIHPTHVYEVDHQKVLDACLVIAYVGQASGGVGMEMEMARANSIPIIVLYEADVPVTNISRMYRGNRAVKAVVRFTDMGDALAKLELAMDEVLARWVRPRPLVF
jgi:hypothetical protein